MMSLMMVGLIVTELLATAILVIGTIFFISRYIKMDDYSSIFLRIQILLTKTSFS